jgi:hypothetical protein
MSRLFAIAVILLILPSAITPRFVSAQAVDYEREIKPLLAHKCVPCHGAISQSAGLRLDAAVLIRSGGDSGPAITTGDGAASLLVRRVSDSDADLRMPPEGEGEPLTQAQIELLARWIDQGAEAPADEPIPEDPAEYWSYKIPVRPSLSPVANASWVRTPIDAMVAAKHQQHGLAPRPEASRAVWLRRVFIDLIGIPPTRQELHDFLADGSADAYERVVDRLLRRPEYGQRWARHWMDVWRYSDWYGSRGGNEIRNSQRAIWRWRDWIVDSLVADKPYDQMVVEMLAGDEASPDDPAVHVATGFIGRNWYKFDRNVWMFDVVEHTGQAFLGLTMRCARCHDHKFDPISQQDYYRFRAFFEPHDVRTDPLSASAAREKDATLGMVLSDGVARVFDKNADVPTFLFRRGDDRSPDESRPLTPGVPASLGNAELDIRPVALPVESYYPSLRPEIADGMIRLADDEVAAASKALEKAMAEATAARLATEDAERRAIKEDGIQDEPQTADPDVVLSDDFASRRDGWNVVSGDWVWEEGKLVERSVGAFATIVSSADVPQDFNATVRYRTLSPGDYRSVGFSFDYVDPGNSQDVYTSIKDAAQSIQAFHRKDGKQEYPAEAVVPTPLAIDEVITVEITARGQQLTITLNGMPKLDYVMPVPRRDGKFALWVHSGSAEFLQVEVRAVRPTIDDLRRGLQDAVHRVTLAEHQHQVAIASAAAVRARVEAERAKYFGDDAAEASAAAIPASRGERLVAVAQAKLDLAQATRDREAAGGNAEASAAAEQKWNEATAAVQSATAAAESPDGQYAPLGEIYPAESTGRRLALARWITHPDHPRTARVAVNQIWLRHFGQAIVPTVANFGLNGQPPSHPELLDWLARELVDNGWRMKPIHRMIVLSATYRQSSAIGADRSPLAVDPDNRFLWRMNSRRMEAEAVRDSVLAVASKLDITPGGPEIAEGLGQSVARRSLYFRATPNERMPLVDTFDGPNPSECYRRQESVVPHQALAMMNSKLSIDQSRVLAEGFSELVGDQDDPATRSAFITVAWETVLGDVPTAEELAACDQFLVQNAAAAGVADEPTFSAGGETVDRPPSSVPSQRARENLVHVLYSHNDFVTIR